MTFTDPPERGRPWRTTGEYAADEKIAPRQVYRRLSAGNVAGAIKDPQGRWRIPKVEAIALMAPPLTREAWELCSRGEHGFLDDSRYEGLAYTVTSESDFDPRAGGPVMVWEVHTCGRCGHSEAY